jgi:hypothetical protein
MSLLGAALALLLAASTDPVAGSPPPREAPADAPGAGACSRVTLRPTGGAMFLLGGAFLGGSPGSTSVVGGALFVDLEIDDWILGVQLQAALPSGDGPLYDTRYRGVRAGRFFGEGPTATFATLGLGSFKQTVFEPDDGGSLFSSSGAAVALEAGLMVHRTGGLGRGSLVASLIWPLFTQWVGTEQLRVPLLLGGVRLAF